MQTLECGHLSRFFNLPQKIENGTAVTRKTSKGPLLPAIILARSSEKTQVPCQRRSSPDKCRNYETDIRPIRPTKTPSKERLVTGEYFVSPQSLSMPSSLLSDADTIVDENIQERELRCSSSELSLIVNKVAIPLASEHDVFWSSQNILSFIDERLHGLFNQMAIPQKGKRWPVHFVTAMLKMQCQVINADYALRWRYCEAKKGMVVVSSHIPPSTERHTEDKTSTHVFVHDSFAIIKQISEDNAVCRTHQSHKTILIDVNTCNFFTRKQMALLHGIKLICFKRDPQGDVVEFGWRNPDCKHTKTCN